MLSGAKHLGLGNTLDMRHSMRKNFWRYVCRWPGGAGAR